MKRNSLRNVFGGECGGSQWHILKGNSDSVAQDNKGRSNDKNKLLLCQVDAVSFAMRAD